MPFKFGATVLPMIFAASVFLLLKFLFTLAGNDEVRFLLLPTSTLVELGTGITAIYSSEAGYFFSEMNVLIDKGCSGFNYWLIASAMLLFLFWRYTSRRQQQFLMIPLSFCVSYFITIFVNSARILSAIMIERLTHPHTAVLANIISPPVLHESIGILTNLSFLILTYIVAEQLLNTTERHAHTS
jgi:exosortase K